MIFRPDINILSISLCITENVAGYIVQFGKIQAVLRGYLHGGWTEVCRLDQQKNICTHSPYFLDEDRRKQTVIVTIRKPACWHREKTDYLCAVFQMKNVHKKLALLTKLCFLQILYMVGHIVTTAIEHKKMVGHFHYIRHQITRWLPPRRMIKNDRFKMQHLTQMTKYYTGSHLQE